LRIYLEEYPDLSDFNYLKTIYYTEKGKTEDDGYRGIHCYYRQNNHSFPIEIQIWAGKDRKFNTWSHNYGYKLYSAEILRKLRLLYDLGEIKTDVDYLSKLSEMVK
jgi:putative GTP pyrophosphokinase